MRYLSNRGADNPAAFPGWRERIAHVAARVVPFSGTWYRGTPIVSFTFDDFPLSAVMTAAPLLEKHKVRGTFYAATGLMGLPHDLWEMAPLSALQTLEAAGHDIGLHTHAHDVAWRHGAQAFEDDLARNEKAIGTVIGGYRPESFAYPYGIGHVGHKRALAQSLRAARSVHRGINAGFIDLHFLRAYELVDSAVSIERAAELIDQAVAARGWLIFVSHDVSDTPTRYGVSPTLLEATLVHAKDRGARVLPVCEALDIIGVGAASGSLGTGVLRKSG